MKRSGILKSLKGRIDRGGLAVDASAALFIALIAIPQALVSGPDTAIAMLIGVTLSQMPLDTEQDYLQHALLLTLMVGVIQLAVTLGRFGRLLDLISSTVVSGLTAVVALSILLASDWECRRTPMTSSRARAGS